MRRVMPLGTFMNLRSRYYCRSFCVNRSRIGCGITIEFKWLEDVGRVVSDYYHIYDHGIY
jgi:hypothetical protein